MAVRVVFQFTPLREGRPAVVKLNFEMYRISIHAPARGATWDGKGLVKCEAFQFTPLREGRPMT